MWYNGLYMHTDMTNGNTGAWLKILQSESFILELFVHSITLEIECPSAIAFCLTFLSLFSSCLVNISGLESRHRMISTRLCGLTQ